MFRPSRYWLLPSLQFWESILTVKGIWKQFVDFRLMIPGGKLEKKNEKNTQI